MESYINNKRKMEERIMAVLKITSDNYATEVENSDKPVLIDFFADWCAPCKMLSPVIEAISEEVSEAKVGKVNVDDEPELAQKFGVMSIPTLVVVKDGKVAQQVVGVKSKEAIISMLK